MATTTKQDLEVRYVPIKNLKTTDYNPRRWDQTALGHLKESIKRFGAVNPLIVNNAPKRNNIIIGGHMRLRAFKDLDYKTVPVVYVTISDIEREKELNIRLNKNTGEFDLSLLAEFDETFLADIGFSSEEFDDIFKIEDKPETFNLKKELEKLDIKKIEIQKGDVWQLGEHRLMCGDSTVWEDMQKLMGKDKADMVMTDPPYRLNYLKGKKKKGKPTEGFGYKRDRKYLETDELPLDFTQKWMANVAKVAQEDFNIICYENWKNLREVWNEMEKHWKVRNMLVWHLPNRTQGFAAKYKFFSKYDIAIKALKSQDTLVAVFERNIGLNSKVAIAAVKAVKGLSGSKIKALCKRMNALKQTILMENLTEKEILALLK